MQAPTAPIASLPTPLPVYEGKAKRVTLRPDGLVEMRYKDDATAFNGQKHALFTDKGVLNSQISELLFGYLEKHGIPTHSRGRLDERTLLAVPAKMFALEAVVRYKVAGSLKKRTGLPENSPCQPPIVEFYYKRDDLGDPLLNDDHIALLKLATPAELAELRQLAVRTADLLRDVCARGGIDLVDLKFEFGRAPGPGGDAAAGQIVLADEVSPDTCRFRDVKTGGSLDKDRFREGTGDLLAGYREALQRLQAAVAAS